MLLAGGGVGQDPVALGLGLRDRLFGLVALRRQAGQSGFEIARLLVQLGLLILAAGELVVQCGQLLFERLRILLAGGGIGHNPVMLGFGLRDRLFGLVALGRQAGQTGLEIACLLVELASSVLRPEIWASS